MSDAKAKAEARRAKILARESDRSALTKGLISSLSEENIDDHAKISNDRPLASRRKLAKDTSVVTALIEDNSNNPSDDTSGDNASSAQEPLEASTEVKDSSITPKLVRQIEEEIAQNTQKFDEGLLGKDEIKKQTKSTETEIVKTPKVLKPQTSPIQAFQIMQLIRLISIILLATATGYFSVTHGLSSDYAGSRLSDIDSSTDRLNTFLSSNKVNSGLGSGIDDSSSESILSWAQRRLVSQCETSVTAVMLVWWLSSMASTAVNRLFPFKPKNTGGILNVIMAYFDTGLQVILEYVVKCVGEVCLHFTVAVCVAVVVSQIFDSSISGTADKNGANIEL